MRSIALVAIAFLAACARGGSDGPADESVAVRNALDRVLSSLVTAPVVSGEAVANRAAVAAFYRARNGEPAWLDRFDRAGAFEAIVSAADDGLRPAEYHASALERLVWEELPESLAERDVLLTDGVFLLVAHHARGKVEASTLLPRWEVLDRDVRLIRDALAAHRVAEVLAAVRDHGEEYATLREALVRLRADAQACEREEDPRERTVRANLERLRWAAPPLEPHRVDVDIAGFQLTLHEPGEPPLELRVLVGTSAWGTPVLSSRIEWVVFNPTWTVPRKILEEELVHRIRADPGWLAREGFRVYRAGAEVFPSAQDWLQEPADLPYSIVQQPGRANALGRVKIGFANPQAVYLHDTPQRSLFAREDRAFTHGCIRVERPFLLVSRLTGKSVAQLEAFAADGETRVLVLEDPVRIRLFYATARVEDGVLSLRSDLYGFDPPLLAALDATVPSGPGVRSW